MSAADANASEPQLSVRFTTQLEALRVTDAPIQLPTRLTRAGLSEVVNHLITAQDGSHAARPFDFLLEGVLVRGSLGQALAKQGMTGEVVATLEYVECLPPPQPEQSCAHEDWIGGLAAHPGGARLLLSACFNNSAYVWNADGHRLAELTGHTAAVKAVAWLRGGSAGDAADAPASASQVLRAASGSKDHTVRTWRMSINGSGNGSAGRAVTSSECEACLVGHAASVESLATNPAGEMLCSGAWDGSVLVWNTAAAAGLANSADAAADEQPSKRAKAKKGAAASAAPPAEVTPVLTLYGHQGSVSALCWPTAALVYSGSWDGTIREWQVESETCSATLAGQPAILSLDVSLAATLIASAHTDHTLRLWDSRLQQAALRLKLPHPGWVSGVKWCPNSAHLLATSCYDGSVRIWDVRSTIPLHEMRAHDGGKALCIEWDGAERLVSGGSDAQLKTATLALPSLS